MENVKNVLADMLREENDDEMALKAKIVCDPAECHPKIEHRSSEVCKAGECDKQRSSGWHKTAALAEYAGGKNTPEVAYYMPQAPSMTGPPSWNGVRLQSGCVVTVAEGEPTKMTD